MAGSGRRKLLVALVSAASLLALPAHAVANGGELDPSFGVGGISLTPAHNGYPQDLAVDHQGRIVVGGFRASPGGLYPVAARLAPDGSFDRHLESWCGFPGSVSGVAIDGADRIVLAGTDVFVNSPLRDICVVRFLSNGELDRSFGGDGHFTLDTVGYATDVAIDREGRILVAADEGLTAVRLTNSGSLDPTFGEGGIASLHLGEQSAAEAIALEPSGGIVLAGTATTSGISEVAVARLDAAGRPDPGFAGIGHETLSFFGPPGGGVVATDIAVDPLGRLMLSGWEGGEESERAMALRLLPNGALDASLGGTGRVFLPARGASVANGVAIDQAGRILATGGARVSKGGAKLWEPFLARLGPEGNADSSFGAGGAVQEGWFAQYGGGGTAVEVDSAGRYLVATKDTDALAVLRFLPEAQLAPPSRRYRCRGRVATIVGTRGRDVLRGTRRRDVIVSLGGNDRIRAFAGRDLVCAGGGRDSVRGGSGNDLLFGGRGNDRLFGQAGRDRLRGGPGSDRLVGGPGRDLQR